MLITLKTEFNAHDIDVVRSGLAASNRVASGRDPGFFPFVFHLVDPQTGAALGGATGRAAFDWVFLELLHVPEQLRGQGHGTRLMHEVEQFGRNHRQIGVWLDTFAFQARPFYERLGYCVFGTLEDHPKGSARFFLQKRLDGAAV